VWLVIDPLCSEALILPSDLVHAMDIEQYPQHVGELCRGSTAAGGVIVSRHGNVTVIVYGNELPAADQHDMKKKQNNKKKIVKVFKSYDLLDVSCMECVNGAASQQQMESVGDQTNEDGGEGGGEGTVTFFMNDISTEQQQQQETKSRTEEEGHETAAVVLECNSTIPLRQLLRESENNNSNNNKNSTRSVAILGAMGLQKLHLALCPSLRLLLPVKQERFIWGFRRCASWRRMIRCSCDKGRERERERER